MKHQPPRNFDREASEADRAYQLAREEEVMDDYERRQAEIAEILGGRKPGMDWEVWVGLLNAGLVLGLCGGLAWVIVRWLF